MHDWLPDVLPTLKCGAVARAGEATSELVHTGAYGGPAESLRGNMPALLVREGRQLGLSS